MKLPSRITLLVLIISILLTGCVAVFPSLSANPAPAVTITPASQATPEYPNLLGKWVVQNSKALETKYIYPVTSYDHDFSYQTFGQNGHTIEFAKDVVIYDAMAYEYHWIDARRFRLGVNIPTVGMVWFVYTVNLDGNKLLLLDERDGSTIATLSKP